MGKRSVDDDGKVCGKDRKGIERWRQDEDNGKSVGQTKRENERNVISIGSHSRRFQGPMRVRNQWTALLKLATMIRRVNQKSPPPNCDVLNSVLCAFSSSPSFAR